MNKLILGLVLSLFSLVTRAELQVQIEPNPVSINDSFQMTLTQDDSKGTGVPDLSGLQKNFLILGTERHVSYSIINGQSTSSNQWIITLKALKAGIITIPAIKMGTEQSKEMTINVDAGEQQQQTAPGSKQQDLMLKTEVNVEKPYVNQQIVYTVKLYNSKRLLDAEYQAPQVENGLVIPLGEAKRYQALENNTTYVVEEQKYAIYPQKSGTLKINSPSFTALVFDGNPQRVKVQDKEITLQVRPIPQQYQGKMWLPAEQVKLSEQYENANQTMNQGSTLIRTVTLEGVAVPAQLLPNLNFAGTDKFNVYPEKGTDRNQIKQGELVGSIEFKVTYLFNKSGKVTIPELQVPWFNIKTGKAEVAVLAPKTIEITSSVNAASGSNTTNQSVPNKTGTDSTQTASRSPYKTTDREGQNWTLVMAVFFACAWIGTMLLWAWQKHRIALGRGQYKKSLDQLKKACTNCNPKEARDSLLAWASLHWPDAKILNLTDLTQLVRDAHLQKQLQLLSQVLYKSNEKALWRGDELLRAVYAIKKSKSRKARKPVGLPPINPF